MTFANTERRRLAELLIEKGPDAPTLCEGWNTADMAAHLWIREHSPAAAGIMVPAFEKQLAKHTGEVKAHPYAEVVKDWAAGPPLLSPLRALDKWLNLAEHFVHLEDVRRGQWMLDGTYPQPREFSRAENAQLAKAVRILARFKLRKSPYPTRLEITGHEALEIRPKNNAGEPIVVAGEPGELLLWLYGRDAVYLEVSDPKA